jgi:hypothetical protein
MRLGKLPRRHDPRTLKLARYLTSALPPAPPCIDYTCGIKEWGMMLNDQLGCCTIAAVAHVVRVWTANAGYEISFPDPVILDYYQAWDGYKPSDPASDQGGVEIDVLNAWRQQGFAGQALEAYGAINLGSEVRGPKSEAQIPQTGTSGSPSPQHISVLPNLDVMDAIWLFGGAYIGVELPISAQTQDVWDVSANPGPDDEPGSWGGHAVYLVGYDSVVTGSPFADFRSSLEEPSISPPSSIDNRQSTITCITWGQLKKMTWRWFAKYCSEAYGLVAKAWLKASGVSPSGFDLSTLEADLKAVTGP